MRRRTDRVFNARFLLAFSLLVAAFLLLPVVFIGLYAFHDGAYFSLPPKGFSLKWFANFFALESFRYALWTSLTVAAIVTPVSMLLALPAAVALVRGRFPGRDLLQSLFLSPLIVPGVVTGIAFLTLFTRLGVGGSVTRLSIAMVCFTLPFGIRALVANLHGLHVSLEEAALNLGADRLRTFLHVTLPQLSPGFLAGSVFVFVEVIDNFSIAVFLTDGRATTLPVEAFSYIRDVDDPTVAAMATLLVALSTAFVLLLERLVGLDQFLRLR